jgi:MFS family permease
MAGALGEAAFRRFIIGTFCWGSAHQLVTLAQGYTLFSITGSTLYIAALGAAVGVPQLIFSAAGGFMNDRLPRKPLLIAGSLTVSTAMAAIAVAHALDALQPWHILLAGAVQGAFLGFDWTTRNAMLPSVVSRPRLVSAVSADLTAFNLARTVAPLAGSSVLQAWGGPPVYAIIAGLLLGNVGLVLTLTAPPVAARAASASLSKDIRELSALVRGNGVIATNMLFTAVNALMAGGLIYLMPVFAEREFDAGGRGLGVLMTAMGAGAFIAGGVLAVRGTVGKPGPALVASNVLFAGAAAGLALSGPLWVGVLAAGAAGLFNSYHIALGAAAIQLATPEAARGRVFGLYEVAWGMFPLGGLVFGALARGAGLNVAVASGALATLAFTLFVWLLSPSVRRLSLTRPADQATRQ